MIEVATLFAMTGPVPVMVELAATAAPAVNTTVPPAFTTGVAMESVFVSALEDFKVQVEIPEPSDDEQADITLVEPVSVAPKVGTIPATGLLDASLRVIVIVDVAVPLATTGPVPEILEFATAGEPAVNTTMPPVLTTGVAIASVFVSDCDDFNVHVDIPEASEEEHAVITLVVPVSVAVKVGTIPETPLLKASLRVIEIVEVATPSAVMGPVPVMIEFPATATPALNTTVPPALVTGVVIESVFVSAKVEFNVHVAIPEASVEEQAP